METKHLQNPTDLLEQMFFLSKLCCISFQKINSKLIYLGADRMSVVETEPEKEQEAIGSSP